MLADVEALAAVPPLSGWALWRASWSSRHTVAAVILAPVLWLGFRSAVSQPGAVSLAWEGLLIVLAALGSLVLASYVPARGGLGRVTPGSTCAGAAGMQVLLAAMILSLGPSVPLRGLLALGVVSFGLAQRVFSVATCPAPTT